MLHPIQSRRNSTPSKFSPVEIQPRRNSAFLAPCCMLLSFSLVRCAGQVGRNGSYDYLYEMWVYPRMLWHIKLSWSKLLFTDFVFLKVAQNVTCIVRACCRFVAFRHSTSTSSPPITNIIIIIVCGSSKVLHLHYIWELE